MKEIKDKVYLLPNIGTAQDFICELVNCLQREFESLSTHSMNEHALFLQGQKDMLGQIITMLKKEVDDEDMIGFEGTQEVLNKLSIKKDTK